jgi:argininosuccinate lyase
VELADALAEKARETRAVPVPDYTYLQVAQVITFGHYLSSFVDPLLRDLERLRDVYEWTDRSPAGAGAVAGTRIPLDRTRLAKRLGFAGPIHHTRDATWQTDGLAQALLIAHSMVSQCSALASDLEIYGSTEFGFVRLDSSVSRASAVMPQKQNPYAIPVIRGLAGLLLGRLTGLLAMQRTPSARTDNVLYAFHEVVGSLSAAARGVELMAVTVRTLHIDQARMFKRACCFEAMATDLAEALCLAEQIDYRSAYNVVARVSAGLDGIEVTPASTELNPRLESAAQAVLGRSLVNIPELHLTERAGVIDIIEARRSTGGATQAELNAMEIEAHRRLDALRNWFGASSERRRGAESELVLQARLRASSRREAGSVLSPRQSSPPGLSVQS